MFKTQPHKMIPVEVDLSEIEVDVIASAAHSRGQTIHEFVQETMRERASGKRSVLVPADSVPGWPFFQPLGQVVL